MPEKSNDPFQFWQELKRRKVFRVVAMYAASAFILLEVVDIIVPALLLPSWTVTLVVVLLAVGFPIAAILSWIFDITPEGVKKTESIEVAKEQELSSKPVRRKLRVSDVIIAVLIAVVGIMAYPKIFKKNKFDQIIETDGKISVAILPFKNQTRDTIFNIWQDGLSYKLISLLSQSGELAVRDQETMYRVLESMNETTVASIIPTVEREVSLKLKVNTIILGSILKAGNKIQLDVQLKDPKREVVLKSFSSAGKTEDDLFNMIDTISYKIKNFLEIEVFKKEIIDAYIAELSTNSSEAYKYFVQGINLYMQRKLDPALIAIKNAVKIDSAFPGAWVQLASIYSENYQFEQAKNAINSASSYKGKMSRNEQLSYDYLIAHYEKNPSKQVTSMKQLIELNPYSPHYWTTLGYTYEKIDQFENAVEAYEEVLKIYDDMKMNSPNPYLYGNMGKCYHELGSHKRERVMYKTGLKVFPDNESILKLQSVCYLSQGDLKKADEAIEQYQSVLKKDGNTEAGINYYLAVIYQMAEYWDKAEESFRQSLNLLMNNENGMSINRVKIHLAYFLIDNDLNVSEGMKHINSVLEVEPDHTLSQLSNNAILGLGNYKQGNYDIALEILRNIAKMYPVYDEFFHELNLNIQEVEKALADQNK